VKDIKGHQDREQNKKLSNEALLNIEADKMATKAIYMKQENTIKLKFMKACVLLNNQQVTAVYTKVLQKEYLSCDLQEYINKSNKWRNNKCNNIWWEVHGKSLTSLSRGQQRVVQKHITQQITMQLQAKQIL
jgi:hypothetical protein